MLGEKIREARQARQLSLAEVAADASISTATLSRIERDKQTLDLGLFLTLTQILRMAPADFFDEVETTVGTDPLVTRISGMKSRERTELWHNLSEQMRVHRKETKPGIKQMPLQLEELLAQADFLRSEIEAVQKTMKKK